MQAINTLLMLGLLFSIGSYIFAMVKPKHKKLIKYFGDNTSRKDISFKLLPVILAFFIFFGITAPASTNTNNANQSSIILQKETEAKKLKQAETLRLKAIEDAKPKIKEVTVKEPIAFGTETQNDSSMPAGQTKTKQEGVNGEKSLLYEVTYQNDIETGRKLKSETVSLQPTTKIILNGTYVAPVTTSRSSSGSGYVNSQGNYVNSPSSDPEGATAKCNDSTYSYSQSRRGTCSHHGGVAIWL